MKSYNSASSYSEFVSSSVTTSSFSGPSFLSHNSQVKWLIILRHISRNVDDEYVCLFISIKDFCGHLTSKDVHDDQSFLIYLAL